MGCKHNDDFCHIINKKVTILDIVSSYYTGHASYKREGKVIYEVSDPS